MTNNSSQLTDVAMSLTPPPETCWLGSWSLMKINRCIPGDWDLAMPTLIARFMWQTWGPSGADRTQVVPMFAPWTLLSAYVKVKLWLSATSDLLSSSMMMTDLVQKQQYVHVRLFISNQMEMNNSTYKTLCTGPRLNIKAIFPRYGDPILRIRRSQDRLIFNMGIPIPVRRHLHIEMTPRSFIHLGSRLVGQSHWACNCTVTKVFKMCFILQVSCSNVALHVAQ